MNPVKPFAKQKHFMVSRVIQPEWPTDPIDPVEIEAVFSKTRAPCADQGPRMANEICA